MWLTPAMAGDEAPKPESLEEVVAGQEILRLRELETDERSEDVEEAERVLVASGELGQIDFRIRPEERDDL